MDGNVGFPLRLISSAVRGQGVPLKKGEVLSIRILSSLGGGKYTASVRGTAVEIRSAGSLTVGTALRVEVTGRGRSIVLRAIESRPGTGAVGASGETVGRTAAPYGPRGIPTAGALGTVDALSVSELDPLGRRLVDALSRSMLPTSPQVVEAVRALVPQSRQNDQQFLRFIVSLFDKHLVTDRDGAESFYRSVHLDGGGGKGGGGSASQHGFGSAGGQPGGDSAGFASSHDHEQGQRELRRRLREQISPRPIAQAGPLAMFNHLFGDHSNWIILPFELSANEGNEFHGTIRLQTDPSVGEGAGAVLRATVVVDGDEEEDQAAFLISGNPPSRLQIFCSNPTLLGRIERLLPRLSEKLRNLGVEIDDTNSGGTAFDGFTIGETDIKGVDTSI